MTFHPGNALIGLVLFFTAILSGGEVATQITPAPASAIFGWRGDGSGRYPNATPPTEWSAKKNVRWNTVIGLGFSSPVLTDKSVFVMAEPNLLYCLNRADGKVKWKAETKPEDLPEEKDQKVAKAYLPDKTGFAAATPITDGKFVYAIFANGIVRAYDLDGKPQWISFIDAEQSTSYGRSSSPILYAGKLIVHMTWLYAFDPATGKQLWKNDECKSNYGTPVGMKVGDTEILITSNGDVVKAADGKSLNNGIGHSENATPVAENGVVYYGDVATKAVTLSPAFKDKEVWSAELPGEFFGSPLLYNGLLYVLTGDGFLSIFDTQGKGTMEPLVKARPLLGENPGGEPVSYASPTLAGKYIYVCSTAGDCVVLEATKEAKQIAKNRLPDGSGATPVFSGKEMFQRDGDKIYCISE